jgi:Tol biopolymer transport system component
MRKLLGTLAIAAIAGFVYVTAATGGRQSGPTAKQSTATTPHNGLIAFVNKSGALAVIRPNGTGLRVVAKNANIIPSTWSPDGSRIAFVRWIKSAKSEAINVLRMDQAGAVPHRVGPLIPIARNSAGIQWLSWHPQGVALLYEHNQSYSHGSVKLLAADGSTTSTLASDEDLNWGPAWSPDGSQIVWTRTLGPFTGQSAPKAHIWIMRADGSNKVQLTQNKWDEQAPTFAPDGSQIAYVRFTSLPPAKPQSGIWIMRPDGSDQHPITSGAEDRAPRFSPNGRWIAFIRNLHKGTGWQTMLVHPDGSGLHRVAKNAQWVQFSPDGRYLLIGSNTGISIRPTTGGHLRHLADGWGPTWQPR